MALDAYIAEAASPDIAGRYTDAILAYCQSLATFPERGTRRDDVRPDLRVTHYRKRAVIAFPVDPAAETVSRRLHARPVAAGIAMAAKGWRWAAAETSSAPTSNAR
jgi:plasmid stabilization system protein ParE